MPSISLPTPDVTTAWGDDVNTAIEAVNTQTDANTLAITGKASASHGHTIAEVTGLQTALDGKQASGSYSVSGHTHAASAITSGTVATARLGTGTADGTTFLRGDGTWQVATANDTDANLKNRANHTGTQAQSTVVNLVTDLAAKAPLASPALTGTPTAPTATAGTNTTQLATTAFVTTAVTGATIADASATVKGKVELATDAEAITGTDTVRAVTPANVKAVITNNVEPALGLGSFDAAITVAPDWTGVPGETVINTSTGEVWRYANVLGWQYSFTISGVSGGGLVAEDVLDLLATAMSGTGLITVTHNDGANTIVVSTTATANSSDATLLARANHTGSQAQSTITNLVTDLAGKASTTHTHAGADVLVAVSAQTAAYTLVLADAGKAVEVTNASAVNVTVPPNSSVAYPVGTVIEVAQMGAGQLTLVAGSGVTLQSAGALLKTRAQYSGVSLRKRATDTWLVVGDLA